MQAQAHTLIPRTERSLGALEWAIIGSLVANVVGLAVVPLVPGADDVPTTVYVVGSVLAVLACWGAWGLWRRQRLGYHLTLWVTVVNTVLSVGAFGDPPSTAIIVGIVIGIVIGVAVIVLLRRPSVRTQISR